MALTVSEHVSLDYESLMGRNSNVSTWFELMVTVSDGSLASETESLQVIVIDVNEPPVFISNGIELTCFEGKVCQ